MKKLLLSAIALLATVSLSAQDVFKKGDIVGNLGIGIGSTLHDGSAYSNKFPPISISGEYGIVDGLIDGNGSIGVGAYIGYASSKYKVLNYKTTLSDVVIGARGTFHYQFVDKLDTYAGIMLGYDIVSVSSNVSGSGVSSSSLIVPVFVGARYYLTEKLGIMAELGYGVSVLNLGISYKF